MAKEKTITEKLQEAEAAYMATAKRIKDEGEAEAKKAIKKIAEALKPWAKEFPSLVSASLRKYVGTRTRGTSGATASEAEIEAVRNALTSDGQTMGELSKKTDLASPTIAKALKAIKPKTAGKFKAKKYSL